MKRKQKIMVIVCVIIPVISLCVLLCTLIFVNAHTYSSEFVPPEFEKNAILGEPNVPEGKGYSLMSVAKGYNIYLCGKLQVNDGTVDVYFTSVSDNTVWVRLLILDENNNRLGETGIIKPGEYVKTVALTSVPESNADVKLKVVGYEPQTYYSEGNTYMKTTLNIS